MSGNINFHHPFIGSLRLLDLTGSLQAADEYMKKWARTFTDRAGRASRSALHMKDAEIQKLKAELERTKVRSLVMY